jgi:hypothetical protein
MGQVIRCITCNEVFVKTPHDQCPEYEKQSNRTPSTLQTVDRDDRQDFLRAHRGHQMEELDLVEDTFVSEKDYLEPVNVSYWKATNGRERFVIKRSREKIDEPLKDQLIAGDYVLSCVSVGIHPKAVAKQLAVAFKDRPLSEDKVVAFIRLLRRVAERVDIHQLERVDEESSTPLEIYYKIDEASLKGLFQACRRIFHADEYPRVEAFVREEKDGGVLLLKATYKIQIVERVKEEETPLSLISCGRSSLG